MNFKVPVKEIFNSSLVHQIIALFPETCIAFFSILRKHGFEIWPHCNF